MGKTLKLITLKVDIHITYFSIDVSVYQTVLQKLIDVFLYSKGIRKEWWEKDAMCIPLDHSAVV